MLPRLAVTLALPVLLQPGGAFAQVAATPEAQTLPQAPAHYDAPAYIAFVEGSSTIERNGRIDSSPLNMPLLSGDRLRTTDGRVEVRFSDDGRLALDTYTSIDVLADDLIRLTAGRVRVTLRAADRVSYRIDSPAGSARIQQPGDYRATLVQGPQDTQLEFAVARGAGEVFTEQGSTPVRAGQRAYASAGLIPSYAYSYNSATTDDFDRWVEAQETPLNAATSQSEQYLPPEMSGYASTFDQYGDWGYQPSYGYVWYPRVAYSWRPYYYGRWAAYPSYGWTWITAEPFGYPTHHYGRWGFFSGSWFWVPSSSWGPAYVSWAYAPNYVSWCPLGSNNAAVFSVAHFNVGPAFYSSHDGRSYSAWTTVPSTSFGHGFTPANAVNWEQRSPRERPGFREGRAPADAALAMGRNATTAPIRYAGTGMSAGRASAVLPADRRSESVATSGARTSNAPRYINRGDEIVRSQTAQPVAPRVSSEVRTAPPTAAGRAFRRGDAADPQPGRYAWDNPIYRPPAYNLPTFSSPAGTQAVPRNGERTLPPRPDGPPPPRTYDQPYVRQGGATQRAAPAGTSPRSGGAPQPSVQRSGPAQRPAGGEAAASRPSSGNQGAQGRAEGRAGGGHVETRAPSAGVAHGRGGL